MIFYFTAFRWFMPLTVFFPVDPMVPRSRVPDQSPKPTSRKTPTVPATSGKFDNGLPRFSYDVHGELMYLSDDEI
jgi:hypothetical protein